MKIEPTIKTGLCHTARLRFYHDKILLIIRIIGSGIRGIPAAVSRVGIAGRNWQRNDARRCFFIYHSHKGSDGAIIINPLGIAEAKPDTARGSGCAELIIGSVGHGGSVAAVVGNRVEEITAAERRGILRIAIADHQPPSIFAADRVISGLGGGSGFA